MGGIILSFIILAAGITAVVLIMRVYLDFLVNRMITKPNNMLEKMLADNGENYTPKQIRKMQKFVMRSTLFSDADREMILEELKCYL